MIYDRDALNADGRETGVNERVFRIGLVGCGRISERHFEAIQGIDGLELAGVCDAVPARARQASERFGAPMFASYEKMLQDASIDAITVATPSGLHAEQGVLAAQHGKHVITEKPMAITIEGADALVSACDTAGVHLFVVKQNRLNPSIQLLRRAIDKGRFGRLYLVNCTVRWSRPQEYYDQASWRGTWEFDGGAFMNQASHYIDLLQWLVGSVESVMAKTATLARRIETEDTGVAILKFRSGALGVIEVTMLAFPRNLEGSITILGEQGSVKIGGTAVNKVEHWEFAEYDDDDKLVDAANTAPPDVYGFGHYGYYRNVLAVLRGAAAPDTDGRAGRKSLELILGMYESAREGYEVRLPLQRSGAAERARAALSRP
jgi:UDP-N-acetyl-2-amino-2-deoxyglucuronate dehydrogenase